MPIIYTGSNAEWSVFLCGKHGAEHDPGVAKSSAAAERSVPG